MMVIIMDAVALVHVGGGSGGMAMVVLTLEMLVVAVMRQ